MLFADLLHLVIFLMFFILVYTVLLGTNKPDSFNSLKPHCLLFCTCTFSCHAKVHVSTSAEDPQEEGKPLYHTSPPSACNGKGRWVKPPSCWGYGCTCMRMQLQNNSAAGWRCTLAELDTCAVRMHLPLCQPPSPSTLLTSFNCVKPYCTCTSQSSAVWNNV